MNIHKVSENLDVLEDVSAKQRSASSVTGANTIDLTKYKGGMLWFISAGAFGTAATLDVKLEESVNSDMSSPSDVASGAITQLLAAGTASLAFRVRQFTKRYVRVKATSAVQTVDYGVTFVGQKRVV
jgi:hypothetical protein